MKHPWDSQGEAVHHADESSDGGLRWYAIHLHARHEKKVASQLGAKGVRVFVPALREVHRWSDRKKIVEALLFPCYAFVQAQLSAELQVMVLHTPGVFRWLAGNERPSPVPDEEIAAIEMIVAANAPVRPHPFICVGRRVRLHGGCLEGLEGILVGRDDKGKKLVVSVGALHQSISLSTEGYDVEPI